MTATAVTPLRTRFDFTRHLGEKSIPIIPGTQRGRRAVAWGCALSSCYTQRSGSSSPDALEGFVGVGRTLLSDAVGVGLDFYDGRGFPFPFRNPPPEIP